MSWKSQIFPWCSLAANIETLSIDLIATPCRPRNVDKSISARAMVPLTMYPNWIDKPEKSHDPKDISQDSCITFATSQKKDRSSQPLFPLSLHQPWLAKPRKYQHPWTFIRDYCLASLRPSRSQNITIPDSQHTLPDSNQWSSHPHCIPYIGPILDSNTSLARCTPSNQILLNTSAVFTPYQTPPFYIRI